MRALKAARAGELLDGRLRRGNNAPLPQGDGPTAAMIVSTALGSAGVGATLTLAGRCYHAVLAGLREQLVARGMSLPQAVTERAGTGDLVSRSGDDVGEIVDAAPQIIPAVTTAAFPSSSPSPECPRWTGDTGSPCW